MKTALVTGASRGIGNVCAETLAKSGCRVVLAARSLDRLQAIAEEIRAAGGEAAAVSMDMTSATSIGEGIAAG